MSRRVQILNNINLIPGYSNLSDLNKQRLNVIIESNDLIVQMCHKTFDLSIEIVKIIELNFYEQDSNVEYFSIVTDGNAFTDHDVDVLFN